MISQIRVFLIVMWMVAIGGINLWSIEPDPGDHVGHWGEGIHTVSVDGPWGVINEGTKIRVMDLSNPASPVMRGTVEIGMISTKLTLIGTNAYSTSAHGWFHIIDISNPENPEIAGQLEMQSHPNTMWIRPNEDYAYIGEALAISVVDISSKTNPQQVLHITTNLNKTACSMTGDASHLYVVSGALSGHFGIWSLSDPSSPSSVGSVETVFHSRDMMSALAVYQNAVYWATSDGLYVVDTSDKTDPRVQTHLSSVAIRSAVFVKDDRLHHATWKDYSVYNLTNPLSPSLSGQLTVNQKTFPFQLSVGDNYAYCTRANYLNVVDVSSTVPVSEQQYSITPIGRADVIAINNNTLFLGGDSLTSLDLSDPTAPALLDNNRAMSFSVDFKIHSDYLYSASFAGIEVWDISNPIDLNEISDIRIDGGYKGRMGIEYPYLSVCNQKTTASLFQIGLDGLLTLKSEMYFRGEEVYATALKFPALYALTNSGKLFVYDITDPTSPTYSQTIMVDDSRRTYFGSHDMEVSGENLHVLLAQRSYTIFTLHDPLAPVRVQQSPVSSQGSAMGIYIDRNKVYLSRGGWMGGGRNNSVEVISTENPLQPTLVGSFSTPAWSDGVVAHNGYIYVAAQPAVLQIYKAWPTPPSPPSPPDGVPVLAYYLKIPSVDPEGEPVLYNYHWTSDGGDSVRHGPKADRFDVLIEWDLVDTGETWTVTVTPNDGAQDGAVAVGQVKILDQKTGAATWIIY